MANPPEDPFAPNDATIMRPQPGRRPGAPPPQPKPPGTGSAPPVPPLPQPQLQATPAAAASAPGVAEFISAGRNPIVQAAVPLLILAGRLRGQISNADVESLRRQCVQEVRAFEDRARQAGVAPEDVLAARYALCTAIDEAVLNTPWGAQSRWAAQSLLVTFHREAQGGEKFFQILDRLLTEPQRYVALLELWYTCLALGFEGRYHLVDGGVARLADIRRDLYQRIEQLRGRAEPELSPQWKGVEDARNAVMRLVPLWVVVVASLAILVAGWVYFDRRLNEHSALVSAALANVGVPHLETPAQLAAPPSGIATLLAPQIAQHLVRVSEQGARTDVTVTVPDLFASGSARVNPRYDSLIHAIGGAVNGIPGRIIVTGHTDDQPVRSFQFHDNYELSRARAAAVQQLLRADVTDASRIEATGKGDSEPLYTPPNLPDNRARNRRVEIEHLRGG
jgi:type VI secretion system protein ImpK